MLLLTNRSRVLAQREGKTNADAKQEGCSDLVYRGTVSVGNGGSVRDKGDPT